MNPDGTPTVLDGENPAPGNEPEATAPTPSADAGGSPQEPNAPTSMIDAVAGGLKAAESPSEGTDKGAPAPTAQDGDTPAADSASPATDKPGGDGEGQPADAELPDEVTDAELKAMHPKTGRRVQQLLRQRAELRQEAAEAQPVMGFIRENRLEQQDVALALDLVAKLQRGDIKAFHEAVRPYVDAAEQALGVTLPEDLREQVRHGYISESLARELAKSRAQAAWNETQLSQSRQREQQERDLQHAQQLRAVLARSVMDWEADTRSKDPDYARKEPVVTRFAKALAAERGAPRTAEEAVQLAKDAYAEANRHFAGLIPRPAPTPTPSTPQAGNGARTGQPAPKSMFEALKQGLARA